MRSSFHTPRRHLNVIVLLAVLPLSAPLFAQAPGMDVRPDAKEAVIALGKSLFSDPRLSNTGSMSCATCHQPDRGFTEDKAEAVGQSGIKLGRNTPTLFGLASVKEFPVGGSRGGLPTMVSLEERVVVPLRDEAEMCGRVGEAIERLAKDPSCVVTFDAVFEEPGSGREPVGVTGDRVAKALAEYVRSLRPHQGPSHAALAGVDIVLDAPVQRGLEVFRGEGRCQSCHSGPSLTDGNLYLVSRRTPRAPGGNSATPAESRPRPDAAKPGKSIRRPGGGYGQSTTLERQTLTLLDVRRTGPYFRDGSVALLSDAVRQHVTEMREIGAIRERFFGKQPSVRPEEASMGSPRTPFSLSATKQLSSTDWIPAELSAQQLDDVVAFLSSLSPSD